MRLVQMIRKRNYSKCSISLVNYSEVLLIYELPKSNMITMLKNGYLIFWNFIDNNYCNDILLKGFKDILHNGVQSVNEDVIFVGTKKVVFLIDINLKMKIKRILLNYDSFSVGYLNNSIFLGLKHTEILVFYLNIILKKNMKNLFLNVLVKEEIYAKKYHQYIQ